MKNRLLNWLIIGLIVTENKSPSVATTKLNRHPFSVNLWSHFTIPINHYNEQLTV